MNSHYPYTIPTLVKDLALGDIFEWNIFVDREDITFPNSRRDPTLNIINGHPHECRCIVLSKSPTSIEFTYLATFYDRYSPDPRPTWILPEPLDIQMWYPFTPAIQEGPYQPLDALSDRAQWASLRARHTISITANQGKTVDKFTDMRARSSAATILKTMLAMEMARERGVPLPQTLDYLNNLSSHGST